jgi:hypothetical protein
MTDGWGLIACCAGGVLSFLAMRMLERVWAKRRPPRDTAELLNRIADVAHPLIEARLTCAWHEAELARQIDNLPPVFEDQVMLAAQLGQAIEQSVMREVQRQGIPMVRLSGQRDAGYSGWISKWLRRASDDVPEKPIITVPDDPQLPAHGMSSTTTMPPSFMPSIPPSRPLRTIVPPPNPGPTLIFRNGMWVPPNRN